MSRKKKIWRKVVSILLTVLIVAGGLIQPVVAEGTSTTTTETESTTQTDVKEEVKTEETSKTPAETESTTQTDAKEEEKAKETSKTSAETENDKQVDTNGEEQAEETSKTTADETENTTQAVETGEGRIEGTLTQGGTPLPNITFSIKSVANGNWYDTKSDETGKYHFDLPQGEYLLSGVWLPTEGKWYSLEKKITVGEDPASSDIDLPAKLEANVKGKLTKDGQPLSKVTFSIHTVEKPEQWYDTTTNSEGQFDFTLSDGEYQLDGIWVASAETWYKLDKPFKVTDGKLVDLENLNIDLKTEQPPVLHKVTGTLTLAEKPLSEILFSLHTTSGDEEWYSTTTNQDGKYEMELPKGEYEIEGIWDPGTSVWHKLDKVFTVNAAMELNIELPAAPTLSEIKGTLTKEGIPLANLPFSVHTTGADLVWYDTKTDDNGAFILKGLPDGDYQLDGIWSEADSKWYLLQLKFSVKDGQLSGSQALSVDISEQEKSVKGRVVKGETPVTDIWVSTHTTGANEKWYDVKTDESGAFSYTLPDGDYLIEGIWIDSESKWYPQPVEFTVVDGVLQGQTELLINLEEKITGNISGTVFDGRNPVANASLYLENADTDAFFGVDTDANGQFSVQLEDGNYYLVSVTSNDIYYLYKKFTVEKGKLLVNNAEAENLDVTLPPASLVLEVHANGKPLVTDGVKVINPEHGYGYWEYADEETGRITYRLPDGTFTVEGYYGEDGFFHYLNQTVVVENGTTNPSPFIIDIDEGTADTVSGVVRDEAGVVPYADFYIVEKEYSWQYLVETGADGSYSVNVPDGEYYISDIKSGDSLYGVVNIAFKVTDGKVSVNNTAVKKLDIVVPAKTLNGQLINGSNPIVGEFYFQREMNGTSYEYSGTTNVQGLFSLRVPDGSYTITLAYGNDTWYEVNRTIEVENGTTDPNPFVIDTAQGNVTGSVKDAAGALANAEFFIEKVGSASYYWVTSDSDGQFSTNIPNGEYYIHEVWGGSIPVDQPLFVDEFFSVVKGKVNQNGSPVDQLTLTTPGETLKAKLVNGADPLSGEVFVSKKINDVTFSYTTVTDENGEFVLRVPDGTYTIIRLFATENVYEINADVEVKNGTTTPSPYVVNISAEETMLQGVVEDENGAISNGVVTIERYTDAGYDGWYSIEVTNGEFDLDLPNGTYKVVEVEENSGIVTLLDQDFSIENSKLLVSGAPAEKLTVTLPAITLKGTLWDGDTQIQSAEIFVIKNNDTGSIYAYTNDQGVFSARLADGSYTVEEAFLANNERIMLDQDFDIIGGKLSINGEEKSMLEIHLPAVNVSGSLSDGVNNLGQLHLTVFDANGKYFSAVTAADGSFQLRLPNGEYVVHEAKYFSETNDYVNYPLQAAFTIADGKLQVSGEPAYKLTITLPPVTLNAKIVDGGTDVAHANLRFIRELNGQFTYFFAMTDEVGVMSYRLPDGTYTLENVTLANGNSMNLSQEIKVENGTTNPAPFIIDIH